MKVAIIGTGYVGLVSGTCFAEIGHSVTCVDINTEKIKMLKGAKSPIYEPGLNELLRRNIRQERLSFSSDFSAVRAAQVIFLAVDTPAKENGEANLDRINIAAKTVAKTMNEGAIVVIKSTVPIGTHLVIEQVIKDNCDKKFHIVNNPEFLKEGTAIDDFMRPDRVVIGFKSKEAQETMDELYAPLVRQGNPIIKVSNISAEMVKYAANSFLATKISFINEIANLCDATGADIDEVRRGIISDKRIGRHFLYPGVGYGGSCFPKDVQALISTGKKFDCSLKIVSAAHEVNKVQQTKLFDKIVKHFKGDIKDKVFALWGVAFKPNTDDIREAPAMAMSEKIIDQGGIVRFYDPVAGDNFCNLMKERGRNVEQFEHKYDCIKNADALVLLTEWMEFRHPDLMELKKTMKDANIFDGRNIFDIEKVKKLKLTYYSIGRVC